MKTVIICILIYLLIGTIIWDIRMRNGVLDDYDAIDPDTKETISMLYGDNLNQSLQKMAVIGTSLINIAIWPINMIARLIGLLKKEE